MKRLDIAPDEIEKWRRMESEEKLPRREIANRAGVSGATVTRKLGAVKPYLNKRRPTDGGTDV